jgi:hypothetical protein
MYEAVCLRVVCQVQLIQDADKVVLLKYSPTR